MRAPGITGLGEVVTPSWALASSDSVVPNTHAVSAAMARGREHTSRATALARRIDFETRSRLRAGWLITKAC